MQTSTTSVTIFPDRARVTRTGQITLEIGLQTLEIGDLPLALLPESVRVAGRGTALTRLLGVSTRREHYQVTPAESVRELEEQIQAGEDGDAALAAEAGILEKEQDYLDALAIQSEMYARGLALRNRTPEEVTAIFTFVRERSSAIQTELLRVARERRELAKELHRLRRELKEVQSARPKQRYTAIVELDVAAPGDFTLDLTYVVRQAGWKPLYDLRISDSELEVTYLAQVAQNTGEDWDEVELTLSTAQPSLALVAPELDPWFIRPMPPPAPRPVRAHKAMPVMAAPAAMPDDMVAGMGPVPEAEAAPPEEELAIATADVSDTGAALTYRLSGHIDIPGNNDPRKVTVAAFSLGPEFDYLTAPKLAAAVYRRATVKNDSAYSLLPGSAQLFDGDEYLGATELEFTAPGQEIELVLGVDERMLVERELVLREVDKKFARERRRIRYGYTIKVENLRDSEQTVLVRDQLPVPRDEQIKAKLEASDPKPTGQTELNLLEWEVTLESGGKQEIRFDFSVEHPRDMRVIGLA